MSRGCGNKKPLGRMRPILAALDERIARDDAEWLRRRLALLPVHWRKRVGVEHARRGGVGSAAANRWLLGVTGAGDAGRLPLDARDADLRDAAEEAARAAVELARLELRMNGGLGQVRRALVDHCAAWGVRPAEQDGEPGLLRMMDGRWYLRRLRRAHAMRAEGAAIRGGVVRRAVWPYASEDAVVRRKDQRGRVAGMMDAALAVAGDGEVVPMSEIVAGSLANPECRRAELMVRIRGCDEYADWQGWGCEFWTLTAPSRFHAQSVGNDLWGGENPRYDGSTPKDAQHWLSGVWARARAAWGRIELRVAGLRTAEPHHDGTPHWHLIVYGPAAELRVARQVLRRYALKDEGGEPGARRHRFNYKIAEAGRGAAAYAAMYVSKNINGEGAAGREDNEAGGYISEGAKRVDAWASHWGIRQFQFFGMPRVGLWRILRKVEGGAGPAGSNIERARAAADESNWGGFWRYAGGLDFIKGAARLTEYGDAAARAVIGVCEGGRRLLVKARDWVIYWGWAAKRMRAGGGDLPRSCVNNCTPDGLAAIDQGGVQAVPAWLAGAMRRAKAAADDWLGLAATVAEAAGALETG